MGIAENKAVYTRFIDEAFNKGNLDHLDDLVTSDYQVHDAPAATTPGAEGVKQSVRMFRTAFPDLHITLEEVIAEGDKVCTRSTLRGTHKGTFLGIPSTGKAITMPSLTMGRIENGRIAESWVKDDIAALMAQLGAGTPFAATNGH